MSKEEIEEEIEEQIVRCKDLQNNYRINDIDSFLRLSKRIEELVMLLDQLEKRKVELRSLNSAKSEDSAAEYF